MRTHLALALLVAFPAQAPPQTPPRPAPQSDQSTAPAAVALFSGTDLAGWQVMPGGHRKRFTAAGGVLRIAGDSGWLRSDEQYHDFVLTFAARRASDDGSGGVLVRVAADGLVLPKHRLAHEVAVASGRDPITPLMQHHDRMVAPGLPDSVTRFAPDDRWHDYWVECRGDRLIVKRDGVEAARVIGLDLNTGSLGFFAKRGVIEFRNLWLTTIGQPAVAPTEQTGPPVAWAGTDGATVPRLLREVTPSYTREALALGMRGSCMIECVVEMDGRVRHPCTVVRRLATDLDAAALEAVEQWEFAPGLRDGKPVPVMVLIEVSFTLK